MILSILWDCRAYFIGSQWRERKCSVVRCRTAVHFVHPNLQHLLINTIRRNTHFSSVSQKGRVPTTSPLRGTPPNRAKRAHESLWKRHYARITKEESFCVITYYLGILGSAVQSRWSWDMATVLMSEDYSASLRKRSCHVANAPRNDVRGLFIGVTGGYFYNMWEKCL